MRHRVQKKKLNVDMDHRKSLQRNLARSLILNGSIETTLAKAKFIRPFVEKLLTKARVGVNHDTVGKIGAKLVSKEALRHLFTLAEGYRGRAGGYTRIVKLGFRAGDKAPMARIEFVETAKNKSTKKEDK